jgi:hypothetical protein
MMLLVLTNTAVVTICLKKLFGFILGVEHNVHYFMHLSVCARAHVCVHACAHEKRETE